MPTSALRSKFLFFSRLFLLAYGLLVGWAVYNYIILPSGVFAWDQAAHSVIGSLIAQDIKDANWPALFYDLYRQIYWPPVHPGLLGIAFAVGGETPVVARSLSLLLFLGSAFLLYKAGSKLGLERGYRVAFIATILFLTSPGLLPFAGQVMLEMTAVFFLILSILLFFNLHELSPSWQRLGLGLALVATFLAKSNYGIILFITLTIELLIEARLRPRNLFSRANMTIALPVIAALAIWFAYPPKIQKTWAALVNIPFGVSDPYSLEGLLYYPRALWASSGNFFFLILFSASLIVILVKLWQIRNALQRVTITEKPVRSNRFSGLTTQVVTTNYAFRNLRFLVLLIIVQLLIAELHQTKVDRHILPVLPAFFLCTGFVLAYEWFDFEIRGRKLRVSLLITAAVLLYAQILLLNSLKPIAPQSEQAVIASISGTLSDKSPTLIITTINQLNPTPPLLEWSLIAGEPALNPVHSDVAMNYDQDKTIAAYAGRDFVPTWLATQINNAVKRHEQPAGVRTVYLDHSDSSYSQNPKQLANYLQELNAIGTVERVIVVIPENVEKSFIPAGTSPFTREFIAPSLEQLGLVNVSTQVFARENTRVEIFE